MLLTLDRVILSGHFEGDSPINEKKKISFAICKVVYYWRILFLLNAMEVLVIETLFVLQHYTTF